MSRIALTIFGQEVFCNQADLEKIVEDYLQRQMKVQRTKTDGPKENEWFDVDPTTINQDLFAEPREDGRQEWTRKIILTAFRNMDYVNPGKYKRPFQVMMPQKIWVSKTAEELHKLAQLLGDDMSDDVFKALEWAQRIQNGETWEKICNEPDTATNLNLIIWKSNGMYRISGGSCMNDRNYSVATIDPMNITSDRQLSDTVPSIIRYKE